MGSSSTTRIEAGFWTGPLDGIAVLLSLLGAPATALRAERINRATTILSATTVQPTGFSLPAQPLVCSYPDSSFAGIDTRLAHSSRAIPSTSPWRVQRSSALRV